MATLEEVRERVEAGERDGVAARREAPFDKLEFRASDDGKLIFQGHAAVFDRLSEDLGGFRERIQRGAFRKVLDANPDVRFLFNHDINLPMARTTVTAGPGMLELREDPKGLRTYAELVATQPAQDLRLLVTSGVVSQMSFSFLIGDQGVQVWSEENGEIVRTIVSFGELFDVGPTTFPAYQQTDATMRANVCGVEILDAGGALLEDSLRELAWKIHRGEQDASVEERAVLDTAFARTDTVSPWIAEQALRAASLEPELRAAIPGKTATVVLEDAPSGEPVVAFRLAARKRRLRALGLTTDTKEQTS